jgi:Mor family transcriptional regulator
LDWIREVEFADLLEGDAALVAEECGIDTLIKLWESFPGISLYISGKSLIKIKARYIKTFYNGKNAHALAIKLKVSERFIYNAINQKREVK